VNNALLEPERWVPAHGYSKYEVSTHGRLRRAVPGPVTFVGKIIAGKPERQRKGYLRACIMTDDGRPRSVSLHRLICRTFHGPAPTAKHHAAHQDGMNTHNWPSNLKWATPKENEADKLMHGNRALGDRHGAARLSQRDVLAIRSSVGKSNTELAAEYGVHPSTIDYAVRRKTWRHI
jgi:hypothetical protein